MKTLSRLAVLASTVAVLAVPVVASAATTYCVSGGFHLGNITIGGSVGTGCTLTGIAAVAAEIINLINGVLVPLLFALAFIVFLWGVAKAYIFSGGSEESVSEGHQLILWGIIGFAVMVSLWGLVNVVANTFGLTGYNAPQPPLL